MQLHCTSETWWSLQYTILVKAIQREQYNSMARSIQPKFLEISVYNWMDQLDPNGNVLKKAGPPLEVGPVQSKLTFPFDLFDSFWIPIPRCSLLSICVTHSSMCSNNSYIAVLRSVCFGCFFKFLNFRTSPGNFGWKDCAPSLTNSLKWC